MTANWTLRYYRDGDEQGILDLLTAAFGRWPTVDIDVPPIDHLRWKLSSHPLALASHYVAVADGRIIGCQLVVVQRLKVQQRELIMDSLTDYAVHPDWQGRGVSRELWTFDAERFQNTFDVVTSITDSRIVKHQIDTMGARTLLANRPEWFELPGSTGVSDVAPSGLQVDTIRQFDDRIDSFCAEACAQFDLCVVRDTAFLNWRYVDPRAGRYTIRLATEHDKPAGFSVLTRSRGKGLIADLLALPDRLDVVDVLTRDALRQFAGWGVATVRSWMPLRHPYRDVLLGLGFRGLRPLAYFGFGPHRDLELPPLRDPNAGVHFMPGDTDIV